MQTGEIIRYMEAPPDLEHLTAALHELNESLRLIQADEEADAKEIRGDAITSKYDHEAVLKEAGRLNNRALTKEGVYAAMRQLLKTSHVKHPVSEQDLKLPEAASAQ